MVRQLVHRLPHHESVVRLLGKGTDHLVSRVGPLGLTPRRKPKAAELDRSSVPPEILEKHSQVTLGMDIMFKDGKSIWVADGGSVTVKKEGEDLWIGGAKVLGSVRASNGMVYVVDAVILP